MHSCKNENTQQLSLSRNLSDGCDALVLPGWTNSFFEGCAGLRWPSRLSFYSEKRFIIIIVELADVLFTFQFLRRSSSKHQSWLVVWRTPENAWSHLEWSASSTVPVPLEQHQEEKQVLAQVSGNPSLKCCLIVRARGPDYYNKHRTSERRMHSSQKTSVRQQHYTVQQSHAVESEVRARVTHDHVRK